ncbi:hypothetical protein SRHO_G00015600 [Serrasalmus rhombeus]
MGSPKRPITAGGNTQSPVHPTTGRRARQAELQLHKTTATCPAAAAALPTRRLSQRTAQNNSRAKISKQAYLRFFLPASLSSLDLFPHLGETSMRLYS